METTPPDPTAAFIDRWNGTAEAAERANYQSFLIELCDVLGVPRPDPAKGGLGDYRFERAVDRHREDDTTTKNFIDLYRRNCFVIEAKQGADAPQPSLFKLGESDRRAAIRHRKGWAMAMQKAKGQAERYAKALPVEEGWPPFLIVADIGFCFDLHADFSGTGKHYAQFPDRERFRLYLGDLARADVRDMLRAIWTDPHSLDPAQARTKVTREISGFLAKLSVALEKRHAPQHVATFLMRCIFSMFAQSVGLLPKDSFTTLLADCRGHLDGFVPLVSEMWRRMDEGGYSTSLRAVVKRFNGGLFHTGGGSAHGNGRDLTGRSRGVMVIDLFGLAEQEVRQRFPAVYQHVLLNLKPQRDTNNRPSYRDAWWIFGEPRRELRPALYWRNFAAVRR